MSAHSNLGPSSAERWMECPGSVALCATQPPGEASFAAAEGTVAHGLAEKLMSGKVDDMGLMAKIGETAMQEGHEIEIDEAMIDAVIEYRDIIDKDIQDLARMGRKAEIVAKPEVRVHAKTFGKDLWGTADFLLYQRGNILRVYDFKYGKGVIVDADENRQMAIYAIAAMETEAGDAFDQVELIIIQPRAPHADGIERRWKAPKLWLANFRLELGMAIKATAEVNAPREAGSWCRWCPAKAVCPETFNAVQSQCRVDFAVDLVPPKKTTVGLPKVEVMPIETLAKALEWEEAINSWYEAIRAKVKDMLLRGENVPGYKLVDDRSNRRWISEDAVVAEFAPVYGEARLFESKLLSPAKLEKMVGKGKVDHLTEKPEPPKTIAKDSDPRPVTRINAAADFTAVPLLADPLEAVGGVRDEQMWP